VKALVASVNLILLVTSGTLGLVAYLAYHRVDATHSSAGIGSGEFGEMAAPTVGPSPTPRIVVAPTSLPRFADVPPNTAKAPQFSRFMPDPTPIAAPAMAPAASGLPALRPGCDPAYPEARTCIPPGPPFDQGCAITDQRRFEVLPPDPQHLDSDGDGIGCEPIASGS
jgi:hypothetical protein